MGEGSISESMPSLLVLELQSRGFGPYSASELAVEIF